MTFYLKLLKEKLWTSSTTQNFLLQILKHFKHKITHASNFLFLVTSMSKTLFHHGNLIGPGWLAAGVPGTAEVPVAEGAVDKFDIVAGGAPGDVGGNPAEVVVPTGVEFAGGPNDPDTAAGNTDVVEPCGDGEREPGEDPIGGLPGGGAWRSIEQKFRFILLIWKILLLTRSDIIFRKTYIE